MTTGHNVTQRWSGTVRFRLPDAEDPPTPEAGIPELLRYNWHLAFAHGNTRDELMADLKAKVTELEANGRIIGGYGDPISIECITTKVVTRTLEEFKKEVTTVELCKSSSGESQATNTPEAKQG